MKNADFKIRLVATLFDSFLWLLLIAELYFIIAGQTTIEKAFITTIIAFIVILFNPFLLFYSIIMTYYFGGTLGKLITGLQVVSEDHKKLSFKRIFFRQTVGYSFSWIFFGIGYLSIVKDPNKQAWHDKTVGSLVVQNGNFLIQGILLSVLLLGVSIYIFIQATQIFLQGPLLKEIKIVTATKPSQPPAIPPPSIFPEKNYY